MISHSLGHSQTKPQRFPHTMWLMGSQELVVLNSLENKEYGVLWQVGPSQGKHRMEMCCWVLQHQSIPHQLLSLPPASTCRQRAWYPARLPADVSWSEYHGLFLLGVVGELHRGPQCPSLKYDCSNELGTCVYRLPGADCLITSAWQQPAQ